MSLLLSGLSPALPGQPEAGAAFSWEFSLISTRHRKRQGAGGESSEPEKKIKKVDVKAVGLYQKCVCWTKESGKDNYYIRINFLLRLQNSHQYLPSQVFAAVQATQVSLLSYSPCLSSYHLTYASQKCSHLSLDLYREYLAAAGVLLWYTDKKVVVLY